MLFNALTSTVFVCTQMILWERSQSKNCKKVKRWRRKKREEIKIDSRVTVIICQIL